MKIEKIDNGYLLTEDGVGRTILAFHTLEEAFQEILAHFEGYSETFSGDIYGKVSIQYGN